MLLNRGGDIKAANADGQTVLHAAAGRGGAVAGLVQFLVDNGADVHAKNKRGQTPLEVATGKDDTANGPNRSDAATVALLSRLSGVGSDATPLATVKD